MAVYSRMSARKREITDTLLAGLTLPEGGWTAPARRAARARLAEAGLPVARDEYWRFARPDKFLEGAGAYAPPAEDSAFAALDRVRLVFRGGVFDAAASDDPAAAGVELLSLAGTADIHWAQELYGALETLGQDPVARPLAALNTAAAGEGVLIRVRGKAPRPVELVYLPQEGIAPVLHHVVKLEPGAEFTLLETGTPGAMANTALEVEVADGASLHHLCTQGPEPGRRTLAHTFARLGTGSRFKSFTLTDGGEFTRNECFLLLAGDHSNAHVAGVAMGGQGTVLDDTVFITHAGEDCESRQVYKKVLRSGAVGVFQGKILVQPGAQKTDGYQISQGLLLDEDAQFLAKPELEIYADDVKCSHGSTCGAIDETALYYLRSRGIPREQAQHLLTLAFLTAVGDEIADEGLRAMVLARLALWLGALA